MKYYKQLNSKGEVVSLGKIEGDFVLPKNTTEITQSEYEGTQIALQKADQKAEEERKAKAEAEAKAAEEKAKAEEEAKKKAQEEHNANVQDYVSEVKAGTVKLADVPDEYRSEVDRIINPPVIPPTNEELNDRLAAAEGAIDFLMMAAGTDTATDIADDSTSESESVSESASVTASTASSESASASESTSASTSESASDSTTASDSNSTATK